MDMQIISLSKLFNKINSFTRIENLIIKPVENKNNAFPYNSSQYN